MITQTKELYASPETSVLELSTEGIICLSPGKAPDMAPGWEWNL